VGYFNALKFTFQYSIVSVVFLFSFSAFGQLSSELADLHLLSIDEVQFEGAFRISASDNGNSDMNYSQGPFFYRADKNSILIVGHNYQQAIAEYSVPALVKSETLSNLNMAQNPVQAFSSVLSKGGLTDQQEIETIGGMAIIDAGQGPELVINAYEYYDAAATNTNTSLVIKDPDNISGSSAVGYFGFSGRAHAARWLSPIPNEWQNELGGSWITGSSSGDPIIGRWPVGPTALVFNPADVLGKNTYSSSVPTNAILDYSLNNRMGDVSNLSSSGTMWTHLSRAVYGFIIPGTRTYFTIGTSGGHSSGICYKCRGCGGYCSNSSGDNDQYYWLFDMEDLVKAKDGSIAAHDIVPYDYGVFPGAFSNNSKIGGGSYDPESGILYLTLPGADRDQGTYSNPPIIVAYKFDVPLLVSVNDEGPAAIPGTFKISSTGPYNGNLKFNINLKESQNVKIGVYDIKGRLVRTIHNGTLQAKQNYYYNTRNTKRGSGAYFLRIVSKELNISKKFFLLQ